jgi:hypothetical protein
MKTTRSGFLAVGQLAAAAAGLCAGMLAAPSAAHAADAAPAPTTIVLKAAHVFDSTGNSLHDGAMVVVTGDKIVSVGSGPAPAGAKVIDLGDATLLPGFIDAHVHLTGELHDNYYKGFYDNMFRRDSPPFAMSARMSSSMSACAMPSMPM